MELDNANFGKYQLPNVDTEKVLCVSGKFPTWFTVSVLSSYSNKEKYIRIPGLTNEKANNFVCVESEDVKNLGQIIDPFEKH